MSKQLKERKRAVWLRDNFICQYCGLDLKLDYAEHILNPTKGGYITIDHVIPKYKGGGNSMSNLVTACLGCNNEKGERERPTTEKKVNGKVKRIRKKEADMKWIFGGAPML